MSSLSEFFGSPVAEPQQASPPPEAAPVEAPAPEPVEEVKTTTVMTPNGAMEIRYTVGEKVRKYELGLAGNPLGETEWQEAVSVTTALDDVLGAGGLPWWGMTTGVAGVLELYKRGEIQGRLEGDFDFPLYVGEFPASVEIVVELLKEQKLTINDVKKHAANRGQNVHDALEDWLTMGKLPDPSKFVDEQQGYVNGLLAWINDISPIDHPVRRVASEVMVGSLKHRYAGRYDGEIEVLEPTQVVRHHTPVRGPQYDTVDPGDLLIDLKTTKNVFPEKHFRQLIGYEGARIECGYKPTDAQYVIQVDENGKYRFQKSNAIFEDFLAALTLYRSNQRMKGKA